MYSEKLLSEAAEKGGFHMAGLAHVSDWLPTILGALGADVSAVIAAADTRGFPLDGLNLGWIVFFSCWAEMLSTYIKPSRSPSKS